MEQREKEIGKQKNPQPAERQSTEKSPKGLLQLCEWDVLQILSINLSSTKNETVFCLSSAYNHS